MSLEKYQESMAFTWWHPEILQLLPQRLPELALKS